MTRIDSGNLLQLQLKIVYFQKQGPNAKEKKKNIFIIMAEPEFPWISKLGEQECIQLMELLEMQREHVRGVVNLRIELYREIPEKFKEERFREIIIATGARITLNHERLTLRRWVFNLGEDALKVYLEECRCPTTGSIQELRKRFGRHITAMREEECKVYLKKAREYIESLVYQSLNNTDANLEDEGENQGIQFEQKEEEISATAPAVSQECEVEEHMSLRRGNVGLINLEDRENRASREVRFAECNPFNDEAAPLASFTARNNTHIFVQSRADMMDKARKWNVKYDGSKKPQEALLFLENVKEKADCYGVPRDLLPELMPECLRGKAIEWFRNNKEEWTSWEHFEESFRVFFAPKTMRIQQEFEVQRFHQNNQSIRDYSLAMQSLMRHIPGYENKERQLDWIYHNLNPEYKNYIRPRDFKTLTDLINLGEEFEQNQYEIKRMNNFKNLRKTNAIEESSGNIRSSRSTSESSSVNGIRWNCDKSGHLRRLCPEPTRYICHFCKAEKVTVENCSCFRAAKMRKNRTTRRQQTAAIINGTQEDGNENMFTGDGEEVATLCDNIPEALTKSKDPRPHITVTFGDRNFKALLDTGAQVHM